MRPGDFEIRRRRLGLPRDLQVYLVPFAAVHDQLDEAISWLGDAELHRATRSPDPQLQQRRLHSYVLLRMVLARRLGTDPQDLHFDLVRRPGQRHPQLRLGVSSGAPGQLRFSLSRTADLLAMAVADRPLGVDIEIWQDPEQAELLLRTLHQIDQIHLEKVPARRRSRAVTAAWTRKEAGLKALGTGLLRAPDRDPTGSVRHPLGPPGVVVRQLPLPRSRHTELAVAWRKER